MIRGHKEGDGKGKGKERGMEWKGEGIYKDNVMLDVGLETL